MKDGSWKELANVRIGDELISFTDAVGTGVNRTIEAATVEAVWETRQPTVIITTKSGRSVVSGIDHLWLATVRPWWRKAEKLTLSTKLRMVGNPDISACINDRQYQAGYIAGCTAGDGTMRFDPSWRSDKKGFPQSYWRIVKLADEDAPMLNRLMRFLLALGIHVEIRPFDGGKGGFEPKGDRKPLAKLECRSHDALLKIAWCLDERSALQWKAGWLAGFLDTDGSFDGKSIRWSQSKDNDYLDRTVAYAAAIGFTVKRENHQAACPTARLYVKNVHERLSFLGAIQPTAARKSTAPCFGRLFETDDDPVVYIARGEVRDLIDITTSTGTFVAEGLATHNCYAMNVAARFSGPGQPYEGLAEKRNGHAIWTGKVAFIEKHLEDPIRWKRPRRIFVNSMSDLFHPEIPDEWVDRIFDVMEATPRHQFQILTKRPERMRDYVMHRMERLWMEKNLTFDTPDHWVSQFSSRMPRQIWLGTSVEDQRRADERIPLLLGTPAAVRFLSCEPLLGPIFLGRALWTLDHTAVEYWPAWKRRKLLHWVITGGESGPRHRPFNPQWAMDIRDQCIEAGVAFFHKQGGGLRPGQDRELDGRLWEQFPDDPRFMAA